MLSINDNAIHKYQKKYICSANESMNIMQPSDLC